MVPKWNWPQATSEQKWIVHHESPSLPFTSALPAASYDISHKAPRCLILHPTNCKHRGKCQRHYLLVGLLYIRRSCCPPNAAPTFETRLPHNYCVEWPVPTSCKVSFLHSWLLIISRRSVQPKGEKNNYGTRGKRVVVQQLLTCFAFAWPLWIHGQIRHLFDALTSGKLIRVPLRVQSC